MGSFSVLLARKLGFQTVILPEACRKSMDQVEGIALKGVSTVRDLVRLMV